MFALRMPTTSAPVTAVPTAAARLLTVPRKAPTSPANSFGEDVTSTLNSSVASAPWPRPTSINPSTTETSLQSFRIITASSSVPTVTTAKALRAICRGVSRPYSLTTKIAAARTASWYGIIETAVCRLVLPCTIWI